MNIQLLVSLNLIAVLKMFLYHLLFGNIGSRVLEDFVQTELYFARVGLEFRDLVFESCAKGVDRGLELGNGLAVRFLCQCLFLL